MSSDSDIALAFKERKEASKIKKEFNQEWSTQKLIDEGISFESKNWGNHLVVDSNQGKIDFWPSTGKFIVRQSGRHGRGIKNLLTICLRR